jgi:F5/8 type C domain/Pectate lyase superfamily protein/Abnormal spindle-like microcephaly-assoc'd, ASPM-SPD-2-Hydin
MRIDVLRRHHTPPDRTPLTAGRRGKFTALAMVAATALFTLPAMLAANPAMAATGAGTPPYWSQNPTNVPSGVGASLPFTEYEAVSAANTGTVIGPSFAQGTLASEATDREAVNLSASGQYVKFTLTAAANAVDLHYAVPQGTSGTLSVYVNGTFFKELPVTAAYSDISTGSITGSETHKFFDDARLMLGQTLAAGSTVSFQVGSSDTDTPYTVNVADFYNVPAAATQPANTVSVVTEGADPTGANDSTSAFNAAITAANNAGEAVWIPSGTFKIGSPVQIQKGTIEGAGDWYSQIETNMLIDNTSDVAGPINLSGFAILGSQVGRNDGSVANGIDGSLGSGWTINGLWIQDTNVGMWLQYGNSNCTVENTVIESTDADGINFNGNASTCTVKNNFLRNTGDDGLAIWSYPSADSNITLENNTVVDPTLANGIADYGGSNNTIENNVVADSNALGSGIDISNEQFLQPGFTPLAGTINVTGNYVIRSGAYNPNWDHPMGAVQFDPYDYSFSGVTINYSGGAILDSPYEAFELVSGDGQGNTISGLNISNVQVGNTGTTVFQAETSGTVSVSGVTASGIGVAGTYNDEYDSGTYTPGAMAFTLGSGNSGWSTTPVLTAFPDPAQPGALAATPASLSFGDLASGSTSAAQAVTVTNPGTSAAPISSVAVTGAFKQTNNCGSSIAVGASCTIEVTFAPTSGGPLTGALTVATSAPGGNLTVALSGTGVTSTTNLALNQPITASSTASGFPASDANDGNSSTYWESLDGSAYPQTLAVDLGTTQSIGSVTLDLPPSSAWATRTETLSVLGSTNGTSFSQIAGSAGYTFNPSTGNTVTISLPSGTSTRYVELSFTGNTGWSAAQVSEFQVFPGGGGGSTPPPGNATLAASPTSLSFGNENTGSTSSAQTVTISNTGSATAAISAVSASAPFGQTNTCGSTLAAGASCTASVTFAPTAAGSDSGNLTVSSNATNSTLSVALTGTGVGSTTTNLALNKPVTASSYTQTYVPANAVDGNTSSYWESNNGSWPATYTVNLGSSTTLGNIVLDLPPSSAWQTRTQTLSVLGSTNNSTWTTLVGSATYTWNPSTGNTVSINLPAGTSDQYLELSFTANNVQNGAQLSELEIFG